MSTPDECNVWTIDTLRAHIKTVIDSNDRRYEQRFEAQKIAIDAAFAAQKEAINAALAAADRAVTKAELASEKRFEGVNEFRNTLSDQQRTLIPRTEVDVLFRGVTEKITGLEGAVGQKLIALEKQFDALIAEKQGVKGGWGYAVGVIGFVLTIVSILGLVFKLGKP